MKGYDGQKYICVDEILERKQPCLIYSFGIAGDITFEAAMKRLGKSG